MRIPLDYYQILGVAFSATSEQIQQSFEDRLQQLPKQQYSNSALATRKKLLQEAHAVLTNPKRRQAHDQKLFPNIENPLENVEPSLLTDDGENGIEIDAELLSGALILLLEFGQFKSVLELGLEFLNREIDLKELPKESGPADDDVALAVAIANLELGREYWQEGDCEAAGNCLKSGLQILQDEDKYIDIQSEIETDLSKLRPYRVLNLLALESDDPLRDEGFILLQDMLDERGGLEGSGDDKSGLSVNDFLLFIQQLRDHLTVDEQFRLFHAESLRPSSVASYLSVYANVARGVSESEPDHIVEGKTLLASLADRQDLSLEQGMCSLLLGQPEAAVHFVRNSKDEDAIAYIQESSAGAPDIIPGLYLYTEQWLQHEVFPYFRDLKDSEISLKQYFNNEGVQAKLSQLEPDLPEVIDSEDPDVEAKWQRWLNDTTPSNVVVSDAPDYGTPLSEPPNLDPEFDLDAALGQSENNSNSSINAGAAEPASSNWFDSIGQDSAESELSELSWGQDLEISDAPAPNPPAPKPSPAPKRSQPREKVPAQTAVRKPPVKKVRKQLSKKKEPAKKPWAMWGAALLLGLGVVWGGLAIGRLFQPNSENDPPVDPAPPTVVEETPSNTTPESNPSETEASENDSTTTEATPESSPDLDQKAAQEIIQAWQKIKADAMGKDYQVDALQQILVEPELTRWQYSSNISQDEGRYTQYQLNKLTVDSFNLESQTVALVRAKIEEKRDDFLANDPSKPVVSLNDSYQVDYRLELIEGKWRIQKMDVVD